MSFLGEIKPIQIHQALVQDSEFLSYFQSKFADFYSIFQKRKEEKSCAGCISNWTVNLLTKLDLGLTMETKESFVENLKKSITKGLKDVIPSYFRGTDESVHKNEFVLNEEIKNKAHLLDTSKLTVKKFEKLEEALEELKKIPIFRIRYYPIQQMIDENGKVFFLIVY